MDEIVKTKRRGFDPLRLHGFSAQAWAVVSIATGAIALDAENRLIMRLTEADARRMAAEMTAAERKRDHELAETAAER